MPACRVINTLNHVIEKYGKPSGIRTDNGLEFTSHLFQNWLVETKIEWVKFQKGKPQHNAIIERFNRTHREDILDANIFRTLDNLRDLTQTWLEEYNNVRQLDALNYQTPS
jgi:putative transposase